MCSKKRSPQSQRRFVNFSSLEEGISTLLPWLEDGSDMENIIEGLVFEDCDTH